MVLISRCRTKANTAQLFADMPWSAMAHDDSMGPRGQELMAKFAVATIPALVILGKRGEVVCRDG